MSQSEYDAVRSDRDPEEVERRKKLSREVMNDLLMRTFMELPENARANWLGNIAVDATRLVVGNRMSKVGGLQAVDPDAGVWARGTENHAPAGDKAKDIEVAWAYDLTFIAAVMSNPGEDGIPHPIIGLSMDKPGHNVGQNAVAAAAHLFLDPEVPRGYVVGDCAYFPHSKVENFHRPFRAAGYKILGAYRKGNLRRRRSRREQSRSKVTGTARPCPPHHRNATTDRLNGTITEEEYRCRLAARESFFLRRKDKTPGGRATPVRTIRGSTVRSAGPRRSRESYRSCRFPLR